MIQTAVIGIGGTGAAIVEYIHDSHDSTLPLFVVDQQGTQHKTTVPAQFYSESTLSEPIAVSEFISTFLPQETSTLIILTGFNGANTSFLVTSSVRFAQENNMKVIVSGVTPFSFEGAKKLKEVNSLIDELQGFQCEVTPFSNGNLINQIDPSTPLEEAVKLNYQRVYSEVVLPNILTVTEPIVNPTPVIQAIAPTLPQKKSWLSTDMQIALGAIIGLIIGIVLALILLQNV